MPQAYQLNGFIGYSELYLEKLKFDRMEKNHLQIDNIDELRNACR
jgi:hypothetical protein